MQKMSQLNKRKTVGILTFQQFHGRKHIGSSRIRGEWLVKYWKEAELFRMGERYDIVIYQKSYFVQHAKAFKGIKILDLCDPDFMSFAYRTVEMIEECDAVTVSTKALQEVISKFTSKPVIYIPDRMDLTFHKEIKKHSGKAKIAVWFGYTTNFPLLDTTINCLIKNKLNLIVIANKDYQLPVGLDKIEIKSFR